MLYETPGSECPAIEPDLDCKIWYEDACSYFELDVEGLTVSCLDEGQECRNLSEYMPPTCMESYEQESDSSASALH